MFSRVVVVQVGGGVVVVVRFSKTCVSNIVPPGVINCVVGITGNIWPCPCCCGWLQFISFPFPPSPSPLPSPTSPCRQRAHPELDGPNQVAQPCERDVPDASLSRRESLARRRQSTPLQPTRAILGGVLQDELVHRGDWTATSTNREARQQQSTITC